MTIVTSEIKYYKSSVVSSDASNGGRLSANAITSGVVNNVWPHVLKAERDAGSTLYRKLFIKVDNDADETLISSEIWNDAPTPAEDYVILHAGTQRDTQADLTGSERIYGAGSLNTDVFAGGSTIIVNVEVDAIATMFVDGDKIRITDKINATDVSGNEEYLTISGAPVAVGSVVTIQTVETLANAYLTSNTKVMSLYEFGDISASFDNLVVTSASGTYDDTGSPIVLDNIGTVEETITVQFTDATAFTVTGDTLGALASGNRTLDYSPNNTDFSKPYFTIPSSGWGGTFIAGDTLVFQTHPAASPIWLKRVVPAGSGSFSGNKNTTVISGESA